MAQTFGTVGLIGVGKMGGALQARLALDNIAVRAFDIKASAMARARAGGAVTVASAAEAARGAAIVHVFVHNDDEVIDCTLAPAGVLAGAAAGTTVILHSTILPATTRRVAASGAERGVHVIDAAVTSVPRQVRAGEATFLVGGPDDVVAEVRPHLENLGRAVWHFGALGAGNAAKLAKNLTNVIERLMWAETVMLAEAAGVDPRRFIDMVLSIDKGPMIAEWDKVLSFEGGRVGPGRAAGLFRKDAQHAARLARELGVPSPLTQKAAAAARGLLARWAEADGEPGGGEDRAGAE